MAGRQMILCARCKAYIPQALISRGIKFCSYTCAAANRKLYWITARREAKIKKIRLQGGISHD
jgi:hypothetical protein